MTVKTAVILIALMLLACWLLQPLADFAMRGICALALWPFNRRAENIRNRVKDVEIAPLGWGPRTLEGTCPHCGEKNRAYYSHGTCWNCKRPLKWKAPKGYRLNMPRRGKD